MSKKIFGLLTALIVTVMLLSALTACQPDFHLHTFAAELSSDGEHHWYAATCEHVDATLEKSAHSFGAAVVTKAATDYFEGEKTYTCTVCGAKKTERIPPKLGEHTHNGYAKFSG